MKVLIAAATEKEVQSCRTVLHRFTGCEFLITGVGMVATSVSLSHHLARHATDAVIHLGIAGSFNRQGNLGETVYIVEDGFPEMGAEDGDAFIPLHDLGLEEEEDATTAGKIIPYGIPFLDRLGHLRPVQAITVNTVHGHEASIRSLEKRWPADIETMEAGAAIYACNRAKVPCLAIRGISNYVERRDRGAWKIEEAIEAVNREVIRLVQSIDL